MWRYQDLPIQRKIVIIIVLGMASAMIVTVANFISFDRKNVKRDLSEEMRVLARITAARSAAAVAFGDKSNALENLNTLTIRSTIQHACIFDENQNLFAAYNRRDSRFSSCPNTLDLRESTASLDSRLLVIVEPIFLRGKRLGFVQVASDLTPIDKRTRKWITTSFLVTIAALFVAILMTRRLQRAVVDPIVHLSWVMDKVKQENDLSLRANRFGDDEVGRLVESFNNMLKILQHRNEDLEMLYQGLVDKSAEAEATAASLEVSNQHIKDLFGSAAHDLRQPLQAMSIFADTLEKRLENPQQKEILAKLKVAMNNLRDLFTEILDVSRYDFNLNVAGTQPTNIRKLLSKLHFEFDALAQDKGIKLKFFCPNYTVLAHAALLERIVRNLLSNAVRYTESGGVLLGCRRRGSYLAIEIWDTGRGIPENKQESIFSKFVQVDEADRSVKGGYGLGLAIVKQFVESLGYELTLRSVENRGTMFRLVLPLAEEDKKARVKAEGAARSAKGHVAIASPSSLPDEDHKYSDDELANLSISDLESESEARICLIDDSTTIRQALKMLLESWGFVVDDFANIRSLKTFYQQGGPPPKLMISDYQIGDSETGDEAILAARQVLGTELPAFIVSGAETEAMWEEIKNTGFVALRKPVKPARLRAMINHLMR